MKNENANIDLYRKLICDMLQDLSDEKFLRQLYSLLVRQQSRAGKLQRELHAMVEEMSAENLRLLYIVASELRK